MLRKILSLSGRLLLVLLTAVSLYLAAAFILGSIEVNQTRPKNGGGITIYLLSNGVHTDIAVPLANDVFDWRTVLSPADARNPDTPAQYVALGWGDRGFYLETPNWSDLTPSVAFKALSGLSTSAIHAVYLPQPVKGEYSLPLTVSREEYRRLAGNILTSFQLRNGRAVPIAGAGYGGNDAFYEARGSYTLFTTCNGWTNRNLKAGSLPAVVWTPFAGSLMDAYRD